jgi:hypothetical protein
LIVSMTGVAAWQPCTCTPAQRCAAIALVSCAGVALWPSIPTMRSLFFSTAEAGEPGTTWPTMLVGCA